jgi:DNA-binding NtrC family response regulator
MPPNSAPLLLSTPKGAAADVCAPAAEDATANLLKRARRVALDSRSPDSLLDVLWVDDEPVHGLGLLLRDHGFNVEWATTGAEALRRVREKRYALLIVDVRLEDMLGLTVVKRLPEGTRVLVVTGHYLEDEIRAEAWRLGAAVAYKPFLDEEALANALDVLITGRGRSGLLHVPPGHSDSKRKSEDQPPTGGCSGADPVRVHGIVAASEAMRDVVAWIAKAGPTNAPVLITGETGVGKDLVATAIHRSSARKARPLVPLNCASIPEPLLESELFGYRKGAFTGATKDHPGLVARANGSTLFLDEIGDLPLVLQAHLLRFLETGEAHRLGGSRTTRFDVRVVAATNRALAMDVSDGRFRADLFFRLAVLHCHIPSLRERRGDIGPLATFFLSTLAERTGSPARELTPEVLGLLDAHDWPGNVRELRHVLERAVCFASGDRLTATDVARALDCCLWPRVSAATPPEMDRTLSVLEDHGGNRKQAARALGIDRTTLWRRLRRYGFPPHRE